MTFADFTPQEHAEYQAWLAQIEAQAPPLEPWDFTTLLAGEIIITDEMEVSA